MTVALPFDATLYGTVYPAASNLVVSSNGNIEFTGNESDYPDLATECQPENDFEATVFALFSDLVTDVAPGNGVYTAVVGSAPNRQFVIEWRTTDIENDEAMNFEVILHEGSPVVTVIYGDLGNSTDGLIVGVQETSAGPFTQYLCQDFGGGGQAVADGTRLDFVPAGVTGSITVNKTGTGGAPLAGAGFTLFASDCTTGVAAAQVTNAGGTATFTGVDASASYCLVETTVPPGYQAVANVAVTLTFDPTTGLFGATVPISNVALAASPTASPSPTPTPAASLLPNTAGTRGTGEGSAALVAVTLALALLGGAGIASRVRARRIE